jgi:hypothetical protein
MTNSQYYDKAIAYMASVPYVCDESIQLITELYNVNPAVVREDITKARKGEYHYAED